MKKVMQRMTVKKKKSPRKHPSQSPAPRQTFPSFNSAPRRADTGVPRKLKMKANR